MKVREVHKRTARSCDTCEYSGGNAPIYYANNLFKFVSLSPKCNMEDDGFDGFKVRCEFLKSRTNKAGQSCVLVYNQLTGFDEIRTLYEYAELNNLVEGRNPYRRFIGFPDAKFSSKTFTEQFRENPELQKALFAVTIPMLERNLSVLDPEKDNKVNMLNVYENVFDGLPDEEETA